MLEITINNKDMTKNYTIGDTSISYTIADTSISGNDGLWIRTENGESMQVTSDIIYKWLDEGFKKTQL